MNKQVIGFALISYEGEGMKVQFSQLDEIVKSANLSVIIGPNGAGKSRALALAIDEFVKVEQIVREKKNLKARPELQENDTSRIILKYQIEGSVFEVVRSGRNIQITKNGIVCSLQEIILPKKVFAFAHLPVDRFRFSRNEHDSFYLYFGLRQATNLTTTGALETKIILSLFKGYGRSNYANNIRKWLKIIKLSTPLRIKFSARSELFEAKDIDTFAAIASNEMNRRTFAGRPQEWDEQSADLCWMLFNELKKYVIIERKSSSAWVTIDDGLFENGLVPEFWAQAIEVARRFRLIQNMGLFIKKGMTDFEFGNLSSGEQQIFGTVSRLLSEIEPNSLVVIDEPEVSLHPQWQMAYLPTLLDSLKNFPSTHVIVATHSHFIVSDVKSEHASLLVASDEKPGNFELFDGDVYGRSPENILYRVFGIGAVGNFYVDTDLGVALQMLSGRSDYNRSLLQKILIRLERVEEGNPAFFKILNEIRASLLISHD